MAHHRQQTAIRLQSPSFIDRYASLSSEQQTSSSNSEAVSEAASSLKDGYPPAITAAALSSAQEGLSKFHLSILSRTADRQRFVTGRYPVVVTVGQNPTQKWLNRGRSPVQLRAETDLLVNGTSPARSLASLDRFNWLDDDERKMLQTEYAMVSMELLAEIRLGRPGYVQLLPASSAGATAASLAMSRDRDDDGGSLASSLKSLLHHGDRQPSNAARDRLWVTGFSLTGRQGSVASVDCETFEITTLPSSRNMLWPNEVQTVPARLWGTQKEVNGNGKDATNECHQDALLVCDGFLVPTKDRGGLYVVRNPGHPSSEATVCLTEDSDRWFYHKAVWIDLTGDGRQSILTARCQISTSSASQNVPGAASNKSRVGGSDFFMASGISKRGELVWLECPEPHAIDPDHGTPLEEDGTAFDPFNERHLPWKTRVLATGPDVMFSVADLDTTDDTVEVISSQFFNERVSLHSVRLGPEPQVTFQRVIDDHCGKAFGSTLADLDGTRNRRKSGCVVLDSGSTVDTLKPGDRFSHLLVTSHECSYASGEKSEETDGSTNGARTPSAKYVVADSPSSPDGGSLFAYRVPEGKGSWKREHWQRTTVATGFKVKGQLNNMINPGAPGFVYVFHAKEEDAKTSERPLIAVAGDCAESAYIFRPGHNRADPSTSYTLMMEIQCGATVGSIGIGYDDFGSADQESGYAKLYIPCYEKDKILVFGLGSGEDEDESW